MLIPATRMLLRVLPDRAALPIVTYLASRPNRRPLGDRDRQALGSGRSFKWGPGRRHAAWSWGEGPTVLLVHGWGARAAQMAPLAQHLASLGFRAVAPDITGHGDSPGRHVSFRQFIDDVAGLAGELGMPLHALVGHSAGGMTMMAAREGRGVRAEHYVCLSAPRAPYPPIDSIRKRLRPRDSILRKCVAHFSGQFDQDADSLDEAILYRDLGQGRLLLIYDEDDERVRRDDPEIIASAWPGAEIVRTTGLGHQKVLWDERVHEMVAAYLCRGRERAGARASHHEGRESVIGS